MMRIHTGSEARESSRPGLALIIGLRCSSDGAVVARARAGDIQPEVVAGGTGGRRCTLVSVT